MQVCQCKSWLTIANYYARFLAGQLDGNGNLPNVVEHTASSSGFYGAVNQNNLMNDETIQNDDVDDDVEILEIVSQSVTTMPPLIQHQGQSTTFRDPLLIGTAMAAAATTAFNSGCPQNQPASAHRRFIKHKSCRNGRPGSTSINPGNFVCPVGDCDRRFASKAAVDYHFRVKHLELRYECYEECGKKFTSSQNLKKHRIGQCIAHLYLHT